jgi:hypothetical protein
MTHNQTLRQSQSGIAMPIRLACIGVLQLNLSISAFAQEGLVTDCDNYAASDVDPQRNATAVNFQSMNAPLAVTACQDAVRQYPDVMRLVFQLGRAYEGVNDFPNAVAQFRKAAEKNYAIAQYDLAYSYENGRGVPSDDTQAAVWYQKAADQGIAAAQYNLGVMYQDGRGVPKDDQQALAWFHIAADQNDAKAQFKLGEAYVDGHGVAKDDEQAVAWFLKAANQGLVTAQISVGVMYGKGLGIPKNAEQGIYWLSKAAELGDRRAKLMLDELESLTKASGQN